jgi:hypothetical protein
MSKDQLKSIVTPINQSLESFTMSAYDILIEEGIEQGIEQGEVKKTRKIIIGILNKFPEWSDLQI